MIIVFSFDFSKRKGNKPIHLATKNMPRKIAWATFIPGTGFDLLTFNHNTQYSTVMQLANEKITFEKI